MAPHEELVKLEVTLARECSALGTGLGYSKFKKLQPVLSHICDTSVTIVLYMLINYSYHVYIIIISYI